MRIISLLFISCFLLAVGSADGIDWYKALNNVISMAVHNTRIDGQFLVTYQAWFPNTFNDRLPEKDTCNRQAYGLDLADQKRFKGALEQVYESGVLRIGVSSVVSLPYFSSVGGVPNGFFKDLGTIVAQEMSFILLKQIRPQFVVIPTTSFLANITSALENNKVDTVIGVSYTKERVPVVDYSCWYEGPSPFAIYRDPSKPLPPALGGVIPASLADWNKDGVLVATLSGTIFENAVNQFLPLATKVPYSNMNAMFDAVGTSAADITFSITGETVGYNAAHGNRLQEQQGSHTVFGGGNAFATRKL